MENLREKLIHEDCDRKSRNERCTTVYILECLANENGIREKILEKIRERAEAEYNSEDEAKHKETFDRYGPKDCCNFMCHAPYVRRALVEEGFVSEDWDRQLGEICEHQYYLGQKLHREVSWNEAEIDWAKSGLAEDFRKRHPFPVK